jgi:hypothetical protein
MLVMMKPTKKSPTLSEMPQVLVSCPKTRTTFCSDEIESLEDLAEAVSGGSTVPPTQSGSHPWCWTSMSPSYLLRIAKTGHDFEWKFSKETQTCPGS